jgi:transposase
VVACGLVSDPDDREAPQRDHSLRELFNALRYVIRYGIAWRAMPNDFPPWAAVYQQSQRWLAAGCFETLAQDLRALLRLASGRSEEPTAAIIDSRTLRSTPESGTRAGYDGAKRKRGSKVHMAVDTLGHLLALHVTPADVGDRVAVGRLAADIQDATGDSVRLAYVDIRATPARQPPMPRGLPFTSSSFQKQSADSSSCLDAGWWNDPSPGLHAAADWSRITSATPQHSPASMSSLSSDTCSSTPQT